MEMQSLQNENKKQQIIFSHSLLRPAKEPQPSPSAPATEHVNKDATQTGNNIVDGDLDMTNESDIAILKENLRNREKQQDKIDRTLETISKELTGIREQQIKDTAELKAEFREKVASLPNKWTLYFWLGGIMIGFGYFAYNQIDKKEPDSEIITSINRNNILLNSFLENIQSVEPKTNPTNQEKKTP